MGGSVLARFVAKQLDPCSACPIDRKLCHGRPASVAIRSKDAEMISLEASAAYGDLRVLQRSALDRACDEWAESNPNQ